MRNTIFYPWPTCLYSYFLGNGHFSTEVNKMMESLPAIQKAELAENLKAAAHQASVKLRDLKMQDPGRKLWCSLGAVLDPQNLGRLQASTEQIKKQIVDLPFVSKLDTLTFETGYFELQRIVKEDLKNPACANVDLVEILCSLKINHPDFANACLKALWICPSNVDCERSFSKYSLVVSDRRRRLLPENAETLTMIAFKA